MSTTRIHIDTSTFVRFWLVILGLAAAGLLLYRARYGFAIVGGALFLALAISPLVRKFANIFPGKNRTLPIALSYVVIIAFIVGFIAIVAPTIINESIKFLKNLPTLIGNTDFSFVDTIGRNFGVDDLQSQIAQSIRELSSALVGNLGNILAASISTLGNIISATILVLVLAFFMLTEGPNILQRFWRNFARNRNAAKIQNVTIRLGQVVSQYVSGAIVVSLFNACFTTVACFVICLCCGLDPGLALPFGLITGVFSLIPMFGSFLGGCIVALLLCFNSLGAGIAFLVYTIVYLQIESNIISPKIQGKGLHLPALVVLAAVTVGVYAFGLIGALVAIPVAGCIKVLLEEYRDNIDDILDDGALNGSNKKATERKLIAKK